jgi:hypothetical protein
MFTFLNERSVEEFGDLCASLTFFFLASRELLAGGMTVRKNSAFFYDAGFQKRFNGTRIPSDVRAQLRELAFGRKFAICWRGERVSDENERYFCPNVELEMSDDSLCEAAELKIRESRDQVAILSAPDSIFEGKDHLSIVKIQVTETATLGNTSSIEGIVRWMAADRGRYDPASNTAPHDFQTVLVNAPGRFRRTNRRERRFGRLIFEDISTDRRYYVDHGHAGPSAHLEVFSPLGEHLGTAEINSGDLDPERKVNGRLLRE